MSNSATQSILFLPSYLFVKEAMMVAHVAGENTEVLGSFTAGDSHTKRLKPGKARLC